MASRSFTAAFRTDRRSTPGGSSMGAAFPGGIGSAGMVELRTATMDDLSVIVDTAARSLDAEAMLRWSFGEDRFEERIRQHFTHYDGENARHGWIRDRKSVV